MAGLIIVCCIAWPVIWLALHAIEMSAKSWRIANDKKTESRKKQNRKP